MAKAQYRRWTTLWISLDQRSDSIPFFKAFWENPRISYSLQMLHESVRILAFMPAYNYITGVPPRGFAFYKYAIVTFIVPHVPPPLVVNLPAAVCQGIYWWQSLTLTSAWTADMADWTGETNMYGILEMPQLPEIHFGEVGMLTNSINTTIFCFLVLCSISFFWPRVSFTFSSALKQSLK